MTIEDQNRIFDDIALLALLKAKKIPYVTDTAGFIDVVADNDGIKRSIDIRGFNHVDLKMLRSSGTIFANRAKTFHAENLKTARGSIIAAHAASFIAPMLTKIDGEWLEGNLDARSATDLQIPKIKSIARDLKISSAQDAVLNELTFVGGRIDASMAQKFHAGKLIESKSFIDISSAEDVHMPRIKKSGAIYLHASHTGKEVSNLIVSETMGERDVVSIYNRNSKMVKISQHKWMALENAREMFSGPKSDQDFSKQYDAFFNKCTVA